MTIETTPTRVKMHKDSIGYPDGFTATHYGVENLYVVPADLAKAFVDNGDAYYSKEEGEPARPVAIAADGAPVNDETESDWGKREVPKSDPDAVTDQPEGQEIPGDDTTDGGESDQGDAGAKSEGDSEETGEDAESEEDASEGDSEENKAEEGAKKKKKKAGGSK